MNLTRFTQKQKKYYDSFYVNVDFKIVNFMVSNLDRRLTCIFILCNRNGF